MCRTGNLVIFASFFSLIKDLIFESKDFVLFCLSVNWSYISLRLLILVLNCNSASLRMKFSVLLIIFCCKCAWSSTLFCLILVLFLYWLKQFFNFLIKTDISFLHSPSKLQFQILLQVGRQTRFISSNGK